MEEVSKINYLSRDKSGNYYYRRKVPAELRGIVGKREFKKALKTADRITAKSTLANINLEVENQLAAAYRELKNQKQLIRAVKRLEDLEPYEIERMGLLWFKRLEDDSREALDSIFVHDEYDYETAIENVKDTLAMFDEIGNETTYKWIDEKASKVVRVNNLSVDKNSTNYKWLKQFIYEGLKEIEERRLIELYKRGTVMAPVSLCANKRFVDAGNMKAALLTPRKDITLSGLIQTYLTDTSMSHLSDKGRYEYEKKLKFLSQMLGKNMLAAAVTRKDMQFVVNILSQLPVRTAGKCTAKNHDEIIKKARKEGKPSIAINTVNHYIDLFTNLFSFACDEKLIDESPMHRLRLRDDEADDLKREPFTIADLNKIFHAPLFTGCIDDIYGYYKVGSNKPRGHRFWILLIALWTGMRQKEICQLTTDSIQQIDGIDVISLSLSSKDRKERQLKTKAARRIIPIHSELKNIGFMRYVEQQRSAKSKWLFPDLPLGEDGSRNRSFQKWAIRFLQQTGAKKDKTNFHSFRHNFADAMRNAEVDYPYQLALGGWESGSRSTNEVYGSGVKVTLLDRELQKIKYDGLDLMHLYVE